MYIYKNAASASHGRQLFETQKFLFVALTLIYRQRAPVALNPGSLSSGSIFNQHRSVGYGDGATTDRSCPSRIRAQEPSEAFAPSMRFLRGRSCRC
jgi:hypothetical protein